MTYFGSLRAEGCDPNPFSMIACQVGSTSKTDLLTPWVKTNRRASLIMYGSIVRLYDCSSLPTTLTPNTDSISLFRRIASYGHNLYGGAWSQTLTFSGGFCKTSNFSVVARLPAVMNDLRVLWICLSMMDNVSRPTSSATLLSDSAPLYSVPL